MINKIKSSGLGDTIRIKNKLNYPMPMGYASVGTISHTNEKFKLINWEIGFLLIHFIKKRLLLNIICAYQFQKM